MHAHTTEAQVIGEMDRRRLEQEAEAEAVRQREAQAGRKKKDPATAETADQKGAGEPAADEPKEAKP